MTYYVKSALLALASALPTHALADWGGAYGGLSLGSNITNELAAQAGDISVNSEADSSITLGVFGGYHVQNGDFVFGGEVAVLRAPDLEFEFNGREFNTDFDLLDLKGRAGYAVNNTLIYGVAGFSRVSENDDDATGFNFGVGADFDFGNNFVVGAEYLARRATFDNDIDIDVDLDTLTLKAAFKF
ncbi:outer membrane beta-barrel protein [uncultured Ruegeria sp.]|uniref:outer membrane protein n=1 Tax=uncultured Ruegeria sp. TaxID=259304 RepID=UPI00261C047C|nr:outer membrane beta-barrel protein [uncultured Ruegeria sp.]